MILYILCIIILLLVIYNLDRHLTNINFLKVNNCDLKLYKYITLHINRLLFIPLVEVSKKNSFSRYTICIPYMFYTHRMLNFLNNKDYIYARKFIDKYSKINDNCDIIFGISENGYKIYIDLDGLIYLIDISSTIKKYKYIKQQNYIGHKYSYINELDKKNWDAVLCKYQIVNRKLVPFSYHFRLKNPIKNIYWVSIDINGKITKYIRP